MCCYCEHMYAGNLALQTALQRVDAVVTAFWCCGDSSSELLQGNPTLLQVF